MTASHSRESTPRTHLHIEPGWPIARKIEAIEDFLFEHYFDEQGLMYSMWLWRPQDGVLRPYRNEDFRDYAFPSASERFEPQEHQSHEDVGLMSGHFLWSQCERFRATGDEKALAYAAKTWRSIRRIFELTEAAGHRGYLCKPYGGRVTRETSPDQYFFAMMGMWAYRAIAPKADRQRIDELLPAMADWWPAHRYSILLLDADLPGTDANWGHNAGHTAMQLMAYEITGDVKYQREAARLMGLNPTMPTYYDLLRAHLLKTGSVFEPSWPAGFQYDPARRDVIFLDTESRASYAMAMWPMGYLMQRDASRAGLYKHAFARYWKAMQFGLREDLLSHYAIQVDLERDAWFPVSAGPTEETLRNPPFNWHFCAYFSHVCWGSVSARLAVASVMAHRLAGDFCPGALSLAKRILRRLDNTRLKWMIDPDDRQLLQPDRWMADVLGEPMVTSCLAYWHARAEGIDLDA